MDLMKITDRGQAAGVTIPRAYLRELNWHKGDWIALRIVDGRRLELMHLRDATQRLPASAGPPEVKRGAPPQ